MWSPEAIFGAGILTVPMLLIVPGYSVFIVGNFFALLCFYLTWHSFIGGQKNSGFLPRPNCKYSQSLVVWLQMVKRIIWSHSFSDWFGRWLNFSDLMEFQLFGKWYVIFCFNYNYCVTFHLTNIFLFIIGVWIWAYSRLGHECIRTVRSLVLLIMLLIILTMWRSFLLFGSKITCAYFLQLRTERKTPLHTEAWETWSWSN